MRGERLARQLQLLHRLAANRNGLGIDQIMAMGRISQSTAYRDLSALQLAGFPLRSEKTDSGQRWRLSTNFNLALPRPLQLAELLSLNLGRTTLAYFGATPFRETLDRLIGEVERSLPEQTRAYLKQMQQVFCSDDHPQRRYQRFNQLIGQINRAATEGLTVEIAYQGLGDARPVRRRIDPYHVWFKNGTIYIVAFCHQRNAQRIFVLDRIRTLRPTEQRFAVPAHFNFEHFTRHSFGVLKGPVQKVRIRISPAWARYVAERTWHVSQAVQPQFDKGIEITFQVSGLEEIRRWILALGPEAQVLEPEELRNRVRDDLAAALAQYPESGCEPEALPEIVAQDPQRRLWG